MRNLRELSQDYLGEVTAGQGVRVLTAIALTLAAAVLAFFGLMLRYSDPGVAPPLPGMNHTAGQLVWAVSLGVVMLIAAWLVRGIVMKQLQVAIVLSLILHLILMLSSQRWTLNIRLPTPDAVEDSAADLEEITLPDYGGMEAADADHEVFQQDSATPDSDMQGPDRQATEVAVSQQLGQTDAQSPLDVRDSEAPERKANENTAVDEDHAPELKRDTLEQPQQEVQQLDAPDVKSVASASQPELDAAAELAKSQQRPDQLKREQASLDSPELSATAAEVAAKRSELRPDKLQQQRVDLSQRAKANARAVETPAESLEVASAAKAVEAAVQEATTEVARSQMRNNQSKQESAAADLRQERVIRADSLTANRSDSSPELANPQQIAAMQARSASPSAATTAAAANAASVDVAAAQAAAQAQLQAGDTSARSGAENSLPNRQDMASAAAPRSTAAPRAGSASNLGRREFADGQSAQAAPTSGGSAAMARNSATGGSLSAAGSSADAVQVATAARGSAPALTASQAATSSTRGAATSVPTQSSGSTRNSPAARGVQVGAAAAPSGSSGSVTDSNRQARLGSAIGSVPQERAATSASGPAGAAGASADQVAVASAAAVSPNRALSSGPSATQIDRQTVRLPAATGGNSGGAAAPRSTGTTVAAANSALSGRAAEPSARLQQSDNSVRGSDAGLPGRAAIAAQLPAATLEAEQSGTLVMAGPQSAQASAASAAVGALGPADVTAARRSAGLPGSASASRPRGPAGRSTLPTSVAANLNSRRSESSGPSLATQSALADLVKQSTGPGNAAGTQAELPKDFAMRALGRRVEAAKALGGNAASEQAVERGLDWLARHQSPDGRWSIHEFHHQCKDHECKGVGSFQSDTAATGLALLAYLGAGNTHRAGKHQQTVQRGLDWLVSHQKANGDLYNGGAEFVWFYSHGMAAIAVCEAFGMTKDEKLRQPAQRALSFIIDSQHPEFGGWRYRPRFETDTSVSGWQLMALKSGEIAGLQVPPKVYGGVTRWLDSVQTGPSNGRYSYHPTKPYSLAMTAEGMLMRQYLGADRNDPKLVAGADYLRSHLPRAEERDAYYWYYATQSMFHMQGAYWDDWNSHLRDMLVSTQLKEGGSAGSWHPDSPTPDRWGDAGGRLYVTCLHLLMLEVYYRHLPLYLQLER